MNASRNPEFPPKKCKRLLKNKGQSRRTKLQFYSFVTIPVPVFSGLLAGDLADRRVQGAAADPGLPLGADLLLPLGLLRLHAGRAQDQEDQAAAGLDPPPLALLLPGGRDGALHGGVLLGESFVDTKRI